MKNHIGYFAMLLLLLALAKPSFSQFTGEGSTGKFYTAAEIKDDASRLDRSDALVKLKGNIVSQLNKDTYMFQDTTGTLKVEIKQKYLPATPFDEKTIIVLIGEVDYDFLEGTEVEAEQMIIIEDGAKTP